MAGTKKPSLNLGIDKTSTATASNTIIADGISDVQTFKEYDNKKLFKLIFPNVPIEPNSSGEIVVLSPIPHSYDKNGMPIFEDNPSASVNLEKGVFYDQVLSEGCTLNELFQKVKGFKKFRDSQTYIETYEKADVVIRPETKKLWDKNTPEMYESWKEYWHFSKKVCEDLELKWSGQEDEVYVIPVYFEDKLIDLRTYRPYMKPKVRSVPGAKSGIMVGEKVWKRDLPKKPITIICAGEKDMLAIRTLGYNAITFTGGESTIPTLYLSAFKNKTVYIAYDHDEAGEKGMEKLGLALLEYGANVYLIKKHFTDQNLKDIKGGDMWDMVNYYQDMAKKWMDDAIENAIPLSGDNLKKIKNHIYPFINLNEVTKEANHYEWRQSNIQALGYSSERYLLPVFAKATKYFVDPDGQKSRNTLKQGDVLTWDFDEDKPDELLSLILNQDKMTAYIIRKFLKVPLNEDHMEIVISDEKIHVVKSIVENYTNVAIESEDAQESDNIMNEAFTSFTVGEKLEVGKKYNIKYQYIANPLNRQTTCLFIKECEEIESLEQFEITESVRDHIQYLQQMSSQDATSIQDQLEFYYEQDLARVKRFNNFDLWLTTSLTFFSSLKFKYTDEVVRGYLDTICIGETRSGKSVMAKKLVMKYALGKIANADGSTTQSFFGGIASANNTDQIRCGSLIKESNGIMVIEEIKDKAKQFFPQFRSIRSSQIHKLDRVAGGFEMKLYLRLLFLTNPNTNNVSLIDMRSNFKNGLEVLSSIVPANEDQARFDIIFLVDQPENLEHIRKTPNPHRYKYAKQIDDTYFRDAIRAVWTRGENNIEFGKGVEEYLDDMAENFKKECNGMHNIYSTEVGIKVARISVALAGLLLSFDKDYQKLIITKEHVDYAITYLKRIYFNDLFRLQGLVTEQRDKTIPLETDTQTLQDIYDGNGKILLDILSESDNKGIKTMELQKLSSISDHSVYNNYYTILYRNKFIEVKDTNIIPTKKLKSVYANLSGINDKVKVKDTPNLDKFLKGLAGGKND